MGSSFPCLGAKHAQGGAGEDGGQASVSARGSRGLAVIRLRQSSAWPAERIVRRLALAVSQSDGAEAQPKLRDAQRLRLSPLHGKLPCEVLVAPRGVDQASSKIGEAS